MLINEIGNLFKNTWINGTVILVKTSCNKSTFLSLKYHVDIREISPLKNTWNNGTVALAKTTWINGKVTHVEITWNNETSCKNYLEEREGRPR
jgi:hypothetical protein